VGLHEVYNPLSFYMDDGDRLFGKLIRGSLDLPSNLSTREITSSSICWINTIIGVHVHIGVAVAHGFKQSSQISPLTPIASVGSRYDPLNRGYIHRPLARSHRPKECGPNGAILPSWGTMNVDCDEILDVDQVEREV
jgi:hypothetical protein